MNLSPTTSPARLSSRRPQRSWQVRVAEPKYEREDLEHYASFHSNPPAAAGPFVALTLNRYGRGRCVYLYSSIFARQQESQQVFGEKMLREYAGIVPCQLVQCAYALRGSDAAPRCT